MCPALYLCGLFLWRGLTECLPIRRGHQGRRHSESSESEQAQRDWRGERWRGWAEKGRRGRKVRVDESRAGMQSSLLPPTLWMCAPPPHGPAAARRMMEEKVRLVCSGGNVSSLTAVNVISRRSSFSLPASDLSVFSRCCPFAHNVADQHTYTHTHTSVYQTAPNWKKGVEEEEEEGGHTFPALHFLKLNSRGQQWLSVVHLWIWFHTWATHADL